MKIIYKDGHVDECPQDQELHVIRHTAAHIMAQAIKRLYPEADFAYGPATDNGFYYDVDLPEGVKISEDDFPAIEAEMKKIVKENLKFSVYEKPRAEAIALMEERGEKYKVEHIGDLDDDARITFYQQGDYIDMCVGPHICYTKALKAFKLTGVSGAYWKGDKDNKMLTRINGVAFATKEELDEHMHMLEEAKKRDHRKIGREMDLFMMRDEAPGFPFFLPNGMILKNTLLDYWREIHHKAGYVEISTPLIMNKQLWKTSGHWDHYKDNMYSTVIDDEEYCIKPMNCPGGVLVYASKPHSYRELPIRAGEIGLVHRHELRGALHGLFRVRCFNQDDAHLFVRPDQLTDEIVGVVNLIDSVYQKFGFKYHVELSTRPEDSMGSDEDWARAEEGLRTALEQLHMDYEVNEGDATAGKMQVVAQVQEYVKNHLSEKLTLADVAAVFNFSPNYLSQLFGKYGDSGFVEYITETRIAAAKEMLEQGDLKVYEIAEKLGYESAFYFSKVFKKVTGLSPREYQQSI